MSEWTVIGKAVVATRARADRIGGGKIFRILEQQGLSMVVPPVANLVAVEDWRADLTENQRVKPTDENGCELNAPQKK
jgi:hypothetical protein